MRSAYPSDFLTSGIAYAFHPHRDTWYSAPYCQINWWMPIYPITAENCMAFHPDYFARPIANNSEVYNYYRWNANNRAAAAQQIRSDTRVQPKPQEPVLGEVIKLLPDPGGFILFSGAHLHATVENTSGVARYSIDFRTVHVEDAQFRRGARNVDSRCTGSTIRDYLNARDLTRLPPHVVDVYNDGTEQTEGPLIYST
jgi:ectoine hydroxylase-related dioxygenase (phytanoyl-CoA dioxygenase family)